MLIKSRTEMPIALEKVDEQRQHADEFQDLLRCAYEYQQEQYKIRQATLFAWWFTCLGLATAGFCYLVQINHWFGVR